jgi:dTDP-4-dehydrorhamnose reductase
MKILVTGAGGMLGSVFCQKLIDAGHEVSGIDIKSGFAKVDIAKKEAIGDFVKKAKPQIIVHTAAYTDVDGCELNPDEAYKINAEGTKNVALASGAAKALLVYISTDYVFDGNKKDAYEEPDKTSPVNIYGKSKLLGEGYAREINKKFLIIRSSSLFGKNGKNFVKAILNNAALPGSLKVVNDQRSCPTYVNDLASAVINLINIKSTGIYHVSNSGICSWYEFADEILKTAGIKKDILPIKLEESSRAAKRPKMSALSCGKYNKATGKPMRHWKEALGEYFNG